MKKSKKLLSVLLAVVMLLSSMSVAAFAAKANYKTVADLEANQAYSPYYAVTRLSTEERMSMVLDFLDITLGAIDNPSMTIPYLNINVNYGSVNGLLKTVDDVVTNGLVKAAINIASKDNLLKKLVLDNWQTGMTREGTAQLTIVSTLLRFLSDNGPAVKKVLDDGKLELGLLNNALGSTLAPINAALSDVPGLLKGFIYPLFERKDDSVTQINDLLNTGKTVDETLTSFVKGLFTKPQSTTTYKEDASGNCVSNHELPTTAEETRYYYVKSGDEFICYAYDTDKKAWVEETDHFVRTAELDADGNPTGYYTYNKIIGGKPADALKYYEKDSYWLPSLQASGQAATIMDISTNNGADMLYQMIPYVFSEMAPVVLNGSVKKSLAEWFGAKFTYVGEVGSDEVNALPDASSSDEIFALEHGDYLWEWSDYAVINGNHYYRFENSIYSGDTSNKNPYFDIINWDFEITGDFMDEFIPGNAAFMYDGRTTVLASLNDFLIKVANTALNADVISSMSLSNGGNENLVENLKKAAQTVVAISPESIFGSNYNDPDKYYSLMMSDNNQEVLLGIACTVVNLVMPQMILPTADKLAGQNYTVGAVLAAVLREIATQLVPDINYDALIYSEADGYNTKTFLPDKDNSYWLDVCLTIGTDIGYKYLTALGDMGEDLPDVFAGANWTASKTYSADDAAVVIGDGGAVKLWEQRVDYIIDWALSSEYEWCWSFGELVDCGSTVDLKTAQDPWVKLGAIFNNILPINQVLNVNADNASNPLWLETALRDNFVLALLDLNVEKIVGGDSTEALLKVPDNSVIRTQALLPAVVNVVRDLLNAILYKGIGNENFISASTVDGQIEQVFRSSTSKVQDNLGVLAQNLLQKLYVISTPLLDAALPIVNFFLGWTTDAQKLNDPSLVLTTKVTEGETETVYPYIYTNSSTATSTLKVINNSSGMLLKHRNSNIDDKDYVLVIDSVEGDFTTSASLPMEVLPYASAELTVNTPYTEDKGVILRVYYHYKFKDGSEQAQKSFVSPTYQFVSNKKADVAGTTTYPQDNDNYRVSARKGLAGQYAWILGAHPSDTTQYQVFDSNANLQSYINSLEFTYTNTADSAAGAMWVTDANMSGNPDWLTLRSSAYVHDAATEPTGAGEGYITKDPESGTVKPYQVNPDVDLTQLYPGAAYIDLGTFNLNWHNNARTDNNWANAKWNKTGGNQNLPNCMVDPGDIYITDTANLKDAYNKYKGLIRLTFPHATDEQWAAMQTAIVNAAAVIYRPFTIADFNAGVYNDNAAKVTAMDEAYKVLEATNNGAAYDVASLQTLKDALAEVEPGGDVPEINYQDYNLYEYFEYQDERTETRNRIKAYNMPEAPENYIEGSALKAAEIDALVAAESNAKKAEAINATVKEPKDADKAAYQEAIDNWNAPNYTVLSNANQAMMLKYYKQFLIANTTNKQFLAKELAYAAAQNYDANVYSADSWANYQTALANANTVNDDPNALQSKVFDAKYELMKAQNELLLKEKSAKEQNKYEALNALITKAEDIFANPTNYNVVAGVAEADAYAALIEALGYKYTDADGNEAILYSRSAYDYVTYDREINDNNMAKVAAAETKLQAAIDNFEALATDPIFTGITNATDNNTGAVDIAHGYVYGVPAGTAVADINKYFSVENGSFEVDGNGTGATLTVKNTSGTVVATYTLVIFGDVDGNGEVDGTDAGLIMQKVAGTATLDELHAFASDVDASTDADSTDAGLLMQKVAGSAAIPVNPYA